MRKGVKMDKTTYIHAIDCDRKGETRLYQYDCNNRKIMAAAKYAELVESGKWERVYWELNKYVPGCYGPESIMQGTFTKKRGQDGN